MMNFKEKVAAVLQKLGLSNRQAGQELTTEEAENLASTYLADYGTEISADAAEWKKTEDMAEAYKMICEAVAMATEEEEEEKKESEENEDEDEEEEPASAQASNIVTKIQKMIADTAKMAAQARQDTPAATVAGNLEIAGRAHTSTHLFGIEHPMFSMEKRWNRVARFGKQLEDPSDSDAQSFLSEFKGYASSFASRYNELYKLGVINVGKLGQIDYSSLKDAGLGEQFVVRRQDALIARIVALPSLDGIFPRRSNIQDKELLTNAFFGDFSQAYQAGEVSKGAVTLDPEMAHVDDAMFKYCIESFKWMEKQYIGYLNTSGSDPIKWNMIEWLILNVSTKLQQERNWRVINGYRVEPVKGANGHFNFAADGLIHTLLRYVEENKVAPFTEPEVNDYTSANIGDVMEELVEKVSAIIPNSHEYVLYANKKHEPWFKSWYNAKYGGNADYSGVQNRVPNHDNLIVWVPNMGNLKLMFMTIPGNILQLENVPGEMNKISFEQRLESVWAYSVWKEGVSAVFAGKKYASAAELEASGRENQMIFMNMPAAAVAADATTLNASEGPIFTTAANTGATAITDITGAKEGVVYVIQCGDTTNASTVAKSDKFADITAEWTPTAVGDYLKVYFDGTKFVEVARKVS